MTLSGSSRAQHDPAMVKAFLSPHADRLYAILRIVAGFLFATHGAQKLFGILGGHVPPFGSQLWIGGVIELATGLCIMLGLLTSWAAFLASGTMAVAYVQFHWQLRFDENFFPAVNKGEPALINAFLFLYIAARGAGPWSIDGARHRS